MTIVRWGIVPILVASCVLAWAVWLLPEGPWRWGGGFLACALWLFTVYFFRNPRRIPQGGETSICAPADGLVFDVSEVEEPDFIGGKALRIGIFLSVFDVHVNRSPVAGTVRYARYRAGRFLDVRDPDCPQVNEANTLGIEVDPGVAKDLKLVVRQLAGLIARRIVCTHGLGDALKRGELYGMIRFGSRTEIYVPVDRVAEVKVRQGDRVRCGETVLLEIRP